MAAVAGPRHVRGGESGRDRGSEGSLEAYHQGEGLVAGAELGWKQGAELRGLLDTRGPVESREAQRRTQSGQDARDVGLTGHVVATFNRVDIRVLCGCLDCYGCARNEPKQSEPKEERVGKDEREGPSRAKEEIVTKTQKPWPWPRDGPRDFLIRAALHFVLALPSETFLTTRLCILQTHLYTALSSMSLIPRALSCR
jgi:hypothetical protein